MAKDNDLIRRGDLKQALLKRSFFPAIVSGVLEELPAVDAVILPCKVGDKIYKLWPCGKHEKDVVDFEITHIDIDFLPEIEFSFRKTKGCGYYYFFKVGEIGKTVFLTREEAERRLGNGK